MKNRRIFGIICTLFLIFVLFLAPKLSHSSSAGGGVQFGGNKTKLDTSQLGNNGPGLQSGAQNTKRLP